MSSANNEQVRWLEEYCSPSNGSLSLKGLRGKLQTASASASQSALACSHFLHEICLHPRVTLEMVESVLRFSPYAAYFCTNRYHGREVAEDEINDCDGRDNYHGNNRPRLLSDRSYPVHIACANSNCPGAVVRLLAESNQVALGHFCLLKGGCSSDPECEYDAGLPIHYYLARSSNTDVETVKCLVEAYPRCLGEGGRQCPDWYHPIHVLTENAVVGDNVDILRYLITKNPAMLEFQTSENTFPIHHAFWNKHVTTEVVKVLIEAWPESVFVQDCRHRFPIHNLCDVDNGNNVDAPEILKILVDANPQSVRIPSQFGAYPIHLAAHHQFPDFLQILVDAYPESVVKRDEDLRLAFHIACERGHAETVKYLYEIYPGCIHVRDYHGRGPIHFAATRLNDPSLEVLKFLLNLDPDGASRAARPDPNGDARAWRPDDPLRGLKLRWHNLFLPLHYAAEDQSEDQSVVKGSMEAIRYLFDLYPEALFYKTNSSRPMQSPTFEWALGNLALTPEGIANRSGHTDAAAFLCHQTEVLATDRAAPFPLHHAIQDDQTLGVVKLLATKWYQDQLSAYDAKNNSPLHCACERGRIDIVNFLLEMQPVSGLEQNEDGKFPIELLLENPECEMRDGVEHTEAIWRLLVANPEAINNANKED